MFTVMAQHQIRQKVRVLVLHGGDCCRELDEKSLPGSIHALAAVAAGRGAAQCFGGEVKRKTKLITVLGESIDSQVPHIGACSGTNVTLPPTSLTSKSRNSGSWGSFADRVLGTAV